MTRWLPLRGFEGRYEISDDGRVKVLAAPGRGRPNRDRELKLGTTTTGYVQVLLYPGAGARPVARRIHHLVLEHFVGERPRPDALGRHLDDNRLNNHYTNLAWGSTSDNTLDPGTQRQPQPCEQDPLQVGTSIQRFEPDSYVQATSLSGVH